jgi:hypothetical protein
MNDLIAAILVFAVGLIGYLAGHFQGVRTTENRYKLGGRK